MKRVEGFTLTDVIITMIISLMITGIAFSIFRMTYNQLFSYQTDNRAYQDLYLLHMTLQNDFNQAEQITAAGEKITMSSSAYKSCEYLFSEQSVIRQISEQADTFLLKTSEYVTYFQNGEQSNGTIDRLSFTVELNNTNFSYMFVKEYPSEMEISNNN